MVSPSWNTTDVGRLTAGGVGRTEVLGVGVPDGVLVVADKLEAAGAGELDSAAAAEFEAVAARGDVETVLRSEGPCVWWRQRRACTQSNLQYTYCWRVPTRKAWALRCVLLTA